MTTPADANLTGSDATARLLRHINARRRKRGWAGWVVFLAALAAGAFGWLAWSYPVRFPGLVPMGQLVVFQALVAGMGLVVLAAGLIIARQLSRAQWAPKAAVVAYKLDETAYRLYLGLQYELESLARLGRAWRVADRPGAGRPVALRTVPLADVKVQLPVRGLALPWISLFFLPTQLLVLQRGRYQSTSYARLTAKAVHEPVPAGGPGLGRLTLHSGETLILELDLASFEAARDVVTALLRYKEYLSAPKPAEPPPAPAAARDPYRRYPRAEQRRQAPRDHPVPPDSPPPYTVPPHAAPPAPAAAEPYTVLGLRPGASRKEIATAYRALAKLYHPDQTLSLGPEVRAAAERKMKEINAAYAALKG
ncbi:MAG: J domain-containing protein [Anaerolineales bacterium]|nr:J domain-containing protein [Anaerolineales bacterium]